MASNLGKMFDYKLCWCHRRENVCKFAKALNECALPKCVIYSRNRRRYESNKSRPR